VIWTEFLRTAAILNDSYRDITDAEIASEVWISNQGVALKTATKFVRTVALQGLVESLTAYRGVMDKTSLLAIWRHEANPSNH
jgi:hypothetical protein